MKLSVLLESSRELSARGDVAGWFALALRYLTGHRGETLEGWASSALGGATLPASAAIPAELDHLGLIFSFPKGAASLADLEGKAREAGLEQARRFPSVLLARALAHRGFEGGTRVEVFKARARSSIGSLQVEVLGIEVQASDFVDARRRIEACAGPLLHLAFRCPSPEVQEHHGRLVVGRGFEDLSGGAALNPHEGLFSSYFDGRHEGSPLRLELCYAAAEPSPAPASSEGVERR